MSPMVEIAATIYVLQFCFGIAGSVCVGLLALITKLTSRNEGEQDG